LPAFATGCMKAGKPNGSGRKSAAVVASSAKGKSGTTRTRTGTRKTSSVPKGAKKR